MGIQFDAAHRVPVSLSTTYSSSSELDSRNIHVLLCCSAFSLRPTLSTPCLESRWEWGGTCHQSPDMWSSGNFFFFCARVRKCTHSPCCVFITFYFKCISNTAAMISMICVAAITTACARSYMWLSVRACDCRCDSPGPHCKSLRYVWVDHDCRAEQSRERSAPEIRQASSFDGDHRLPGAVKLLRLEKENTKTVIEEVCDGESICVIAPYKCSLRLQLGDTRK